MGSEVVGAVVDDSGVFDVGRSGNGLGMMGGMVVGKGSTVTGSLKAVSSDTDNEAGIVG